jgi:glycosyltransferase involved in cell wall biosynthesis
MPEISVITINLNNAAGLEKTMQSVLEQDHDNFEFIVIDGGSSDGSAEIIRKKASGLAYWVSEKDKGIYQAMNKGISASRGRYLLFLNSGDYLLRNDVLKRVSGYLDGTDVISGDLEIFHDNEVHHIKSEDAVSISYFRRISLYHQATFVRKKVFTLFGDYDEAFRLGGDYEFFIRVLPVEICHYNTDGISNSASYLAINMRERRMAWEKNFNPLVLKDLDELYEIKSSPFFWIINKTRRKRFFYYFFKLITLFFLIGYRILERIMPARK